MLNYKRGGRGGFNLVELLVTAGVLVILALLLIPTGTGNKASATRVQCMNNLRTLGVAFHTWADAHGGEFPVLYPTNYGGTFQYIQSAEAFRHFQVLSNELASPEFLVCPADVRKRASEFGRGLTNDHLSYFAGVDATPNSPLMFLAGDRNLTNATESVPLLILHTNSVAGWTQRIHVRQGNVGLADGSVQQLSNTRLREALSWSGVTNRLAMP